jgi:V8-like Glu-specific endopeptidase
MALGTTNLLGRIAAVAASVAALLATSAWVFHADDRRPSRSARIGTLSIELPQGSGTGTAFLVDECGILTNFHVVFGPWYVTALRPPSHDFTGTFTLTEVTLPDGSHPSARAMPVVWGDYLGADRQWRRPEEDWAYLTLEPCLGTQYGYYDLREADLYEPPVEKGFTAIGYSAGRQMVDPGCAARADAGAGGKGWVHDCALLPGDSGAPIFRAGTLTVVALGSGYRAQAGNGDCLAAMPRAGGDRPRAWGGGCANVAVPITTAIRDRTWDAMIGVCLQDVLARRGYDTGAPGVIEGPQLQAAIQQAQRDMGWNMSGRPLHHLCTMQCLRLATY